MYTVRRYKKEYFNPLYFFDCSLIFITVPIATVTPLSLNNTLPIAGKSTNFSKHIPLVVVSTTIVIVPILSRPILLGFFFSVLSTIRLVFLMSLEI